MKILRKKLLYASLFAIAMAYLEAAVVVYLRELYYPSGFSLSLVGIPSRIYITEIIREIATIAMLFGIAGLAGKSGREIFAYFCFNFGLWDIWYYIWLKVLINWPLSLFDGDILFLIPWPWIGPVLAPVIISMALIIAAYFILRFEQLNNPLRFTRYDWGLEILSGIILITSFVIQGPLPGDHLISENYPWWLFTIGLLLGLFIFTRRILEKLRQS